MNNTATTKEITMNAWESIIEGLNLKAGDAIDIMTKPFVDSEKLKIVEGMRIIGTDSIHLVVSRPDGSGRFYIAKKTILALDVAA